VFEAPTSLQADLADRYALERLIGRGGMASVFLATDRKHARRVAVKVLRADLAAAIESDRFLREIQITAGLLHPHILPLFDSGAAAGTLFFVTPFVEGESLRERLDRERQLPVAEAVHIARQVGEALEYAHYRGFVHRDVKPENILLSAGQAYLADFGIARAITSAGVAKDDALTAAGLALGTVAYMSPEQASADSDVDHRSDIYSLACVIYEVLAGAAPFRGSNARAIMTMHLVDPVPTLRAMRPSVPEAIDRAIQCALAKAPADRFATVTQFVDALTRAEPVAVGRPLRSVLVLPFANVTRNLEHEYFADGLTDEVIADLSNIRGLRVISRSSAMRLKGTERDTAVVARELGVEYVLEGSVRRSGNDVRITARLIDAAIDAPVWADKYTGTLDQVFQIQESLSRSIVDALKITLSSEERQRLAERPFNNAHAYECFLQARQEMWRFSPDALARAVRLAEQAITIVGDDSLLYATLACAIGQHLWAGVPVDESYLRKADEYVAKSFALAPDSHYGHLARGLLLHGRGEFQAAARDLKKVLAVNPNSGDALSILGYVYALSGREAAARSMFTRLIEVDPLTPINYCTPGFVAVLEGHPADALAPYRRFYELAPDNPAAHWFYTWALAWNEHIDEAADVADRFAATAPQSPFTSACLLIKHAIRGERREAREVVSPSLRVAARRSEMLSRELANFLALAGETQEALDHLENANRLGLTNYPFVAKRDRFLASLRLEPRFHSLMARMERQWEAFEI
jgi:serine/threonine protein kinase/Tfp pilus assembly protein PilF